MNHKADDVMMNNAIYIILVIIAFTLTYFIISSHVSSAAVWAEFYSKELTKVVNLAEPGDQITLDVHKATQIAVNKEVPFNEIFSIDNQAKKICVKLAKGRQTCYNFFNDVNLTITSQNGVDFGIATGVNTLQIKVEKS